MTDTERDLLRAVNAEPGDDAPRLAYADFLDEQPDAYRDCPNCNGVPDQKRFMRATDWYRGKTGPSTVVTTCPECDGAGFVPDDARKRRAEFIRVQIELSKPPTRASAKLAGVVAPHLSADRVRVVTEPGRKALLEREAELHPTARHEYQFGCADLIPKGAVIDDRITFVRGFVGKLMCSAADWLRYADKAFWSPKQRVRCDWCKDGWHYSPGREHRHGGETSKCSTCDGTGFVPRPFDPACQPLTDVTLTGAIDWDFPPPGVRLYIPDPDGIASRIEWYCRNEIRGDLTVGGETRVTEVLEAEFPGVRFHLG